MGKDATKEWVTIFLSQCIQTFIEDDRVERSEDKMTWRVKNLSPGDIRKALEAVAGTQFKGRTVYLTPVVINNETPDKPSSSEGEGDDDDDKPEGDGKPEGDDDKTNDNVEPDNKDIDEEGFALTNSEKKKRRAERKRKEKEEKKAEDERAKALNIIKDVKPSRKPKTAKVSPKGKKNKDDNKRGHSDVEVSPGEKAASRTLRHRDSSSKPSQNSK